MKCRHAIPMLMVIAMIFCNVASAAEQTSQVIVSAVTQREISFAAAKVNFSKELNPGPITVRVYAADIHDAPTGPALASKFIADAEQSTRGRVVWRVAGDGLSYQQVTITDDGGVWDSASKKLVHNLQQNYVIVAEKQASSAQVNNPSSAQIPDDAELIFNGGFEALTPDHTKPLGQPWFDPRSCKVDDQTKHSGQYSLRIRVPATGKGNDAFQIIDLRVLGGKSYVATFWAMTKETDSHPIFNASIFWADKDHNRIYDSNKQMVIHSLMPDHRAMDCTFGWRKFEQVVTAPPTACFAMISLDTWTHTGGAWIDDLSLRPLQLPDDKLEAARELLLATTYPNLAMLDDVSSSVVTPHVPWAKPDSAGPIKTLYLAQFVADTDGIIRNVVELQQRAQLDLTFMPVLKQKIRQDSPFHPVFADDLEEYSLLRLAKHLQTHFDLVIVDGVDFKGVQPIFLNTLLETASVGSGLVFMDCTNLPAQVTDALRDGAKASPDFSMTPDFGNDISPTRTLAKACQSVSLHNGRLAVMVRNPLFYPCVPRGQLLDITDTQAWQFPGWEYRQLVWLKALRWAAGKPSSVFISSMTHENDALRLTLEKPAQNAGILELAFQNNLGQRSQSQRLEIKQGAAFVDAKLDAMTSGMHVAEYRLLDESGSVRDFGAKTFTITGPRITALTTDAPSYRNVDPIQIHMTIDPTVENAVASLEIVDAHNRVIARKNQAMETGAKAADFRFELSKALCILHRAVASLSVDKKIVARRAVEFNRTDVYPSDLQFNAYLWSGGPVRQPGYMQAVRAAGFDQVLMVPDRLDSVGPALLNANLRPLGYWLELGDFCEPRKTADASLKVEPNFTDASWWAKRSASIAVAATKLARFGARDCLLSDEANLSPEAGFDAETLKAFSVELSKQYSDLNSLNAQWGTQFKTWDEVRPRKLKECIDANAPISSWLDHKIYMTTRFADVLTQARALYSPTFPEIKIGLSGTQQPGFAYNWPVVLERLDCLANYGGIQDDLIRSFKKPGLRSGRWTGGYAVSWADAEQYVLTQPWQGIFEQSNCYYYYQGSGGFGMRGDLRINANAQKAMAQVNEIKSGIDMLLLSAKRQNSGVAIYYSHASFFASEATLGPRAWEHSLMAWKYLMDDLGLCFNFVSDAQVRNGALKTGGVRVLILPLTLCLSDADIAALTEFVRAGGMVVSDDGMGIFDGYGGKQSSAQLGALLGVERDAAISPVIDGELSIDADPIFGGHARKIKMRTIGQHVKLLTAQAKGRILDQPALLINTIGKGRVLQLHGVLDQYAQTQAQGGGETQVVSRGDPQITLPMLQLIRDVMSIGDVHPPIRLTSKSGDDCQPMTRTFVFGAGAARYVGIIKPSDESLPIRAEDYVPVTVDLGSEAHTYDVRTRQYLGKTQRIKTTLAPSVARLFAVLPYKVQSLNLTSTDAQQGEDVMLNISLKVSHGAPAPHVIAMDFFDPSGVCVKCYSQKILLDNGTGSLSIRTALSDLKGSWRVEAVDIASGVRGDATFVLR